MLVRIRNVHFYSKFRTKHFGKHLFVIFLNEMSKQAFLKDDEHFKTEPFIFRKMSYNFCKVKFLFMEW